jgi:hypothetical protein
VVGGADGVGSRARCLRFINKHFESLYLDRVTALPEAEGVHWRRRSDHGERALF